MDDRRYPAQPEPGYAIKAVDGALELDVVGLPFGTDKGGHTVTRETDIGLRADESVPVYYHHGYAERGAKAVERIARAIYRGVGNVGGVDGHVFRVVLDGAKAIAQSIYESAKQGKARASSDSAPHLVRPFGIVGQRGTLSSWPVLGLSLMDAATYLTAVNPNALALPALKAFVSEAGETGEAGGVEIDPQRLLDEIKRLEGSVKAEEKMAEETKIEVQPDVLARITKIADLSDTLVAIAAKAKQRESDEAANAQEAAFKAKVDAAVKAKMDEMGAAQNRPGFRTDAAKADDPAAKAELKQFDDYLRNGNPAWLTAAKATMNEATAGQGGYLVPVKYSNELTRPLTDMSILRMAGARVLPVEGTNSFKWPVLTPSAAATITAESGSIPQAEPILNELTFTPYALKRLGKATDELLADSRFDVFNTVLRPDMLQAFAAGENGYFSTGTGTGQPQGVVTGASAGVTAASATTVTADEVIDLFYSLNYLYRQNAVWLMNDATAKIMRKLKDTTGDYLWQNGLQAGQPASLLGRPVYTLNAMDTPAAGKKTILFGDMSYFMIADFNLGQPEVKRLEELYAGTGEMGFRMWRRVDARVLLSAAIKYLAHP